MNGDRGPVGGHELEVAAEAVCAVVVTYHPDTGLSERLGAILPQVGGVVLVDNGSGDEARAMLAALAAEHGLGLVELGANLGLPAGINRGAAWARARGYRWVLLLDQDTTPLPGMARSLLTAYLTEAARGRPAIVGASWRAPAGRGRAGSAGPPGATSWRERALVINSGTLLALALYDRLGPYREEFFVDILESDYCLRARARGVAVLQTSPPTMVHAVGAQTPVRFLGRTVYTSQYPPWRRYLIVRNQTVLVREHGWRERAWARSQVRYSLKMTAKAVLLERDKVAKVRLTLLGLLDGARGKFDRDVVPRG